MILNVKISTMINEVHDNIIVAIACSPNNWCLIGHHIKAHSVFAFISAPHLIRYSTTVR